MSSKDWQLDKSIAETNLYMLEHQISSDITFKVGGEVTCDSRKYEKDGTEFKAHGFILISRSAVFAAMILGDTNDTSLPFIPIPDVTPEAFKNTLDYMYTEKCSLSADTVLATLYCSMKYLITGLTKECISFLEENLTIDNVCLIYDQCLLYSSELATKCRRLIERKTDLVLRSPVFVTLPESAVINMVKLERLGVGEWVVFRAVLKWAKEECKRRGDGGDGDGEVEGRMGGLKRHAKRLGGVSSYSDLELMDVGIEQLRSVIQPILPYIRFPCMSVQEFLDVSKTSILPPHERVSIFEYLLSEEDDHNTSTFNNNNISKNNKISNNHNSSSNNSSNKIISNNNSNNDISYNIPYLLVPRLKPGVVTLKRFTQFTKSNIYSGDCSMMKMSCNKSISLVGFCISASCDFDPVQDVQLSIKHERRFLFHRNLPVNDDMRSPTLNIQLGTEVHLQEFQTYCVIFTFHFSGEQDQGICKRGKGGSKVAIVEGYTFEFDRSDTGSLISEVHFCPADP